MNQHSNPKIRFKEFVNNWNNYKLGQLGNFKSGIGFPDSQQGGTEGIPFFKVSDMNNIGNETEMRNANNYVTQEQIMKNSWKVIDETPAIIFAKVGAALMLNRKRLVTRPFLIDNNTMSYSFDESWDKDFGLTLFQTINLPKYAQIGALPSYNASDIAMIKVNVPNVHEQSAIGSLFRTLDDLLDSYKDNLANYQSLKATMLSKMFPKAGQTVPEIRLDGFEGEWEFSSLGEQADITKLAGFEFTNHVVYSEEGEIPAIRGLNVKNQKVNLSDVKYIDKSDFSKLDRSKLIEDDLLFTYVGTVGEVARVPESVLWYLAPNVSRIRLNRALDSRFVLYQMASNRFKQKQIFPLIATSSQPALSMANIRKFIISFTTLEEQQAIGSYFSNLDNLISAHQEKISQLETLKKKLLQDMFI
ncbi:restriction endonuclease subunit S [Streptococcus oralis]|jgi:restriction modification system, specificity subunit|uniref:Restriction endonuclease subunit S n=1 Tax=Streptococcus oralis TaxID=1303 RepID=A0A7T3DWA6_STROR|nr:restriction endonuclease subunit S [Streptococcus oralis]QPS97875.1 restriction endonuclease subunit S [Streptococcus oralis]